MSVLRAFLLWALMLAVPFQGYAAASMLQCAPGPSRPAAAKVPLAHAAPDHHAHAQHAAASADAGATHGAHDHASADGKAAHSCGTCGICHAVALIGMPQLLASGDLPPADLAEPAHAIATRAPRVLDKPPRA